MVDACEVGAASPNNEDSDSDDEKGPGPAMYAIHACKDHGVINLAAHASIRAIMKARNCAHRKNVENSYQQVHVPRGTRELNIQLGNSGSTPGAPFALWAAGSCCMRFL
jgi:hypothetical protein